MSLQATATAKLTPADVVSVSRQVLGLIMAGVPTPSTMSTLNNGGMNYDTVHFTGGKIKLRACTNLADGQTTAYRITDGSKLLFEYVADPTQHNSQNLAGSFVARLNGYLGR
ncbi:MAG: hypothetical protein NVSMB39_5700 [Candidatus Saccharimonadales bacterium]